MKRRLLAALFATILLGAARLHATEMPPVNFETETLPNGLRVIYAPMPQSPVTHVRVLYHVGSKDERPDRQGFAHMFEHMMFRGSQHVAPEQHMKLIGDVGGYSNAFTSFDQTVYVNTVPASHTEMALWLEADRMASFKVSPAIFHTERLVVAEEWRLRANQPYGTMWEELLNEMYKQHAYRWTPIGNMDQLRAAKATELQEFFNTYYVPNNAVLVVAGKIDVTQTKDLVKRYYGWVPKGEAITRLSPKEPAQTESRRREVSMRVPLARVAVAWPLPAWKSDDQDALGLLSEVLGGGRSSRLSRALVTNADPLCTQASAMVWSLEDGGPIGGTATVLAGKSVDDVEKVIRKIFAEARETKVTAEELAKAKQQAKESLVQRWQTADKVASELGEEMLFRGNLDRVNDAWQRLEKITADDLQRVAQTYFTDERATTLVIRPEAAPTTQGKELIKRAPGARPVTATQAATQEAPSTQPVSAREVSFPADYPTKPPMAMQVGNVVFEKGVEENIAGVKVIVMRDNRLPIVNWSLTMRQGSLVEPADKDGLANLTAAMVRRGFKGTTFDQLNETLEANAISLEVADGGDNTRISGSCLSEQVPQAMQLMRSLLREPSFEESEFAKLKSQTLSGIKLGLNNPANVAEQELDLALYGDTALGRYTLPKHIEAITLADVKAFYEQIYRPTDAVLVISGDIKFEDAVVYANKLLAGWEQSKLPAAKYELPEPPAKRRIILIDRPDAKQANIRLGIRAYDIKNDDKFAGQLAGQLLSSGISSRLGRYVRAEKGYAYGVWGVFQPTRQAGHFEGGLDTRLETTADAVEAMFKVFSDLRTAPVNEQELTEAKLRVAGGMLMQTQTIQQQAGRRLDVVLNGYPLDYYDVYPARIAKVTAAEIQAVAGKYIKDDQMTIVVVAPAEVVKEPLSRLGEVIVKPMPLK